MKCSCIEGEWEFSLTVLDVKTLEYKDLSKWNERTPYVVPDLHQITILDPMDREFVIDVIPQGSTWITNSDLGQPGCLEDGLYCISAYSCRSCVDGTWGETKFSKTEFLGPQMLCKVRTQVAKGDTAPYMKYKQIEASGKLGLTDQMGELYSSLEEDLSMLNCDNCC